MDFKIVFIDDNMSEKEPFVQNIRKHYKDADCNHVFQNPDKGLEFVLENLNSKMLVFIDWNFSGHHKKGIDLLKEIRKKTSLLYIVIMSANQLRTDIPLDSIIEMMNEENFFYLDRSNDDFESVISILTEFVLSGAQNLIASLNNGFSVIQRITIEKLLVKSLQAQHSLGLTSLLS